MSENHRSRHQKTIGRGIRKYVRKPDVIPIFLLSAADEPPTGPPGKPAEKEPLGGSEEDLNRLTPPASLDPRQPQRYLIFNHQGYRCRRYRDLTRILTGKRQEPGDRSARGSLTRPPDGPPSRKPAEPSAERQRSRQRKGSGAVSGKAAEFPAGDQWSLHREYRDLLSALLGLLLAGLPGGRALILKVAS